MQDLKGRQPFWRGGAALRHRLSDRSKDVLDFAAELFGASGESLPHREAVDINISRTLLMTIEVLNSGMDFLRLAAQLAPAPILREVVALAFAAADGLSAVDAEDRADLALAEAQSSALARPALDTAVVVHTLVSRTVRFRDTAQHRQRTLRRAACAAFATIIQASNRSWEGKLPTDVAHAEILISSMLEAGAALTDDEAEALVLLLQQLYPYTPERGAFWQAAFETCRRLLGEGNPTTLIAMNRRAVWLYAFGDADEALDLQEKVFELSRSTLGDRHVDTRIALQNLKETFDDRCAQFKSHDPKQYAAKLQALLREVPLGGGGNGRSTFMNNPV